MTNKVYYKKGHWVLEGTLTRQIPVSKEKTKWEVQDAWHNATTLVLNQIKIMGLIDYLMESIINTDRSYETTEEIEKRIADFYEERENLAEYYKKQKEKKEEHKKRLENEKKKLQENKNKAKEKQLLTRLSKKLSISQQSKDFLISRGHSLP